MLPPKSRFYYFKNRFLPLGNYIALLNGLSITFHAKESACVTVWFVGALQYIIGDGTCWLWIWCLLCNPGFLFLFFFGLTTCSQYFSGTVGTLPEDLNSSPARLYVDIECFEHETVRWFMFIFPYVFSPHAIRFFPQTDSPTKPQLTPKSNA